MSKELQDLLCSCGSDGHDGASNRYLNQKDDFFDNDDDDDDCLRYESSDRDEKYNNWKVLNDDSWDVIAALRQKLCQHEKSEAECTTARGSPRSSHSHSNRQPFRSQSFVERASSLIDYSPESEFLKKIKQQCHYLHNRLPNIFSALNECFPEDTPHECQRHCSEQAERRKFYADENLNVVDKKSEHISRSRKPVRHRKIRKRKSKISEKYESENDFEPSLKKPNENSCERCWRYASPARSPVNKPDQRYDPNFRKAHSITNFEKGDGDPKNRAETFSGNVPPKAASNIGREFLSSRHTYEAAPKSSGGISTPFSNRQVDDSPPQICIKQKVQAVPPTQHLCPKHKCSIEVPQPPPPPTNPMCPIHKCSLQQHMGPPPAQHLCSRHRSFEQQPEPIHIYPRPKCPIHDRESLPTKPSSPCQSSFTKVKELMHSPEMPCKRKHHHQCKQQSEDLTPRVLCSDTGRKPRPHTCSPGSSPKDRRGSPEPIEDLNVTEYKDICTKPKKQSSTQDGSPSRKESPRTSKVKESPKASSPKSAKQRDHSSLEPIPEADTASKTEAKSKKNRLSDEQKRGSSALDTTKNAETDGKGAKSKKSPPSGQKTKGKSESPSPKSKSKQEKGRAPKKTPDKSKSSSNNKSPTQKVRDKTTHGSETRGQKSQAGHTCPKKGNPLDTAHPVIHCKCTPRIPEAENDSGPQAGHILCCHCDWKETANKSNASSKGNEGKKLPSGGNSAGTCGCSSAKTASPDGNNPQTSKGKSTECPYRAFLNKFGSQMGQRKGSQEEGRRLSKEGRNETPGLDQAFLECSPRKYFVFYMTKSKDNNDNDVEVLVEELAQGCPKETASRTKDLTEKMKKISEHPPDSMALRFQKGVSEACNVPHSSRILYF